MATDLEQPDIARLRHAVRNVIGAARTEAAAFRRAAEDCADDSMKALHASHLDELDAVQALLAALELFERRATLKRP